MRDGLPPYVRVAALVLLSIPWYNSIGQKGAPNGQGTRACSPAVGACQSHSRENSFSVRNCSGAGNSLTREEPLRFLFTCNVAKMQIQTVAGKQISVMIAFQLPVVDYHRALMLANECDWKFRGISTPRCGHSLRIGFQFLLNSKNQV